MGDSEDPDALGGPDQASEDPLGMDCTTAACANGLFCESQHGQFQGGRDPYLTCTMHCGGNLPPDTVTACQGWGGQCLYPTNVPPTSGLCFRK